MKKILSYIVLLCGVATLWVGCSKDADLASRDGDGVVSLAIEFDNLTRATPTNVDALKAAAVVNIYRVGDGLVRTYTDLANVPASIYLAVGNYRVDIESADATGVVASFTQKAYKGSQTFAVTANNTEAVAVACTLKSVVVAVAIDQTVTDEFASWTCDVATDMSDSATKLTFNSSTATQGYFTLPAGVTDIDWAFTGTRSDATVVTKTGTLSDVESAKRYTLGFKYTSSTGNLEMTIYVDKSTEDIDDTIIFDPITTGAIAVPAIDVWATTTSIGAIVGIDVSSSTVEMGYRKVGDTAWTKSVATTSDNKNYSVALSALTASTEYEYVLLIDDVETGSVLKFTTDTATVLPNAGFEEWNDDAGYPMPWLSGNSAWWGNGNQAANMASLVISSYDSTDKVEGNYSAKLSGGHINMIGGLVNKVAPGNIFTGEFAGTVGTNGGKVNFGRPFTARPTALKFKYKYSRGNITHNGGAPAGETYPNAVGDPDRGHIYIMVGDWTAAVYGGTANCPVQVNTTIENTLMDLNGANVIGGGELVITESVTGWTEYTIPLTYYDTQRRPTHIIVSATSSKLGDYLTGSTNSVMWLDDLELIY